MTSLWLTAALQMLEHAVHQVSALTCDCALEHCLRRNQAQCAPVQSQCGSLGRSQDYLRQLSIAIPLRSTLDQSSACCAGHTAILARA